MNNYLVNCSELKPEEFESLVIKDSKVWLLEFYSGMCGSCKEFAPVWNKLENTLQSSISLGKINIDDKKGLKIAEWLGALDEGIPHLRLFLDSGDSFGSSLKICNSIMPSV